MFAECYDVVGKQHLLKITALHIHKLWMESKLMRVNIGYKLIAVGSNEEKSFLIGENLKIRGSIL